MGLFSLPWRVYTENDERDVGPEGLKGHPNLPCIEHDPTFAKYYIHLVSQKLVRTETVPHKTRQEIPSKHPANTINDRVCRTRKIYHVLQLEVWLRAAVKNCLIAHRVPSRKVRLQSLEASACEPTLSFELAERNGNRKDVGTRTKGRVRSSLDELTSIPG